MDGMVQSERLVKLQMQQRKEANITLKLLALAIVKPTLQLTEVPDWSKCINVSLEKEDNELINIENEIIPAVSMLAAKLVHDFKNPTDICVVKQDGKFTVFVQTEAI